MALLSSTGLLYALPALVIYYIASSYLAHRRLQRFAKANDATFPKYVPTKLPLGVDFVWRAISTARNGGDILDDVIGPNYAANGTTFSMPGFFGPAEVYTIDPANIQAVLANKFKDFDLGERRIKQFKPLLGNSIFTADGAFWEHSRALFRPQFSRDQINDLEKTEAAVQALFKALPLVGAERGGAVTVDIMPMLFRFTLDTATGFLFGESVESQMAAATGVSSTTSAATAMAADQSGNDMTFAEAFHEAQAWITTRVRLQGLYWLAPEGTGKKASDYLRRYTDHYVRMALSSAKPTAKEEGYSLLDTLAEQTRDEDELRDQILGLLLAGRDTTATLLSWVLLLLAQHPAVFERLRADVVQDFGEYSDSPSNIDFGTLKSSKYLQFVLRETLRVYNVVPLNIRVAARDTVLPRGGGANGLLPVVVRKGQTVNFSPYLLHRRADVWEAALEFKPERWEGVRLDWNYVPFSGGPRICLGQQFALTEAGYLLVRLLQRFKSMEWLGPQGKPRKDIHFTMAPRDGVNVRLQYA
ncbi:cytochrome P450 [Colletotrichum tofieldiae]|uniref:Cytochrome P450 n=1 Tax=Colletotrichum tofieldiae TaxID=708197 RepID=A0A166ZBI2_9PEZI|nr:cytochrome P450 [Colletotrichum tofieldiae]GKT55949.1 cytochrome P450 [Colletotrichum tofieldiae]GKT79217.1 cytochrome P450 [Colletotrichum tofieldiae]